MILLAPQPKPLQGLAGIQATRLIRPAVSSLHLRSDGLGSLLPQPNHDQSAASDASREAFVADEQYDVLTLTSEIISAFVANNSIRGDDIPALIRR